MAERGLAIRACAGRGPGPPLRACTLLRLPRRGYRRAATAFAGEMDTLLDAPSYGTQARWEMMMVPALGVDSPALGVAVPCARLTYSLQAFTVSARPAGTGFAGRPLRPQAGVSVGG